MAAAAAAGVAVSASSGTVCFALFFNGVTEVDNAEARRTGAFHLGDGVILVFPRGFVYYY